MHQAIPYSSGRRSSYSWPSTSSSPLSPPLPSPPLPIPIEDKRPTPVNAASEALELRCGGSGDRDSNVISKEADHVKKTVEENPVVVVGRRGCFMVHVARKLLLGQGVNPMVCEVGGEIDEMVLTAGGDHESSEKGSQHGEEGMRQQKMALPAVFIGGKLVGGVDRLMAVHISGELVPILKQAGALWL